MTLLRLARHPDSPAPVLAALTASLTEDVAPGTEELRAALLAHPSTPAGAFTFLVAPLTSPQAWTVPLLRAAASRRGDLPPPARALLTANTYRSATIRALTGADSAQVDTLLARVAADPDTRHTVVPALIDAPALDPRRAARLATVLTLDPRPLPAARTWLVSVLERRCPQQAADLAHDLALRTPDQDVRTDLLEVSRRGHQHRYVSGLIAAGAAAAGVPREWAAALRAHPDTDGTLATAALAATTDRSVLTAVVTDTQIPVPVRARAALALRATYDREAAPWPADRMLLPALFADAGPGALADLAAGASTWAEVDVLLAHRGTPAAALATCLTPTAARWTGDPRTPPRPVIAARFATHPHATDDVRARARDLADADASSDPALARYRTLTGLAADLATHPETVAAALPAHCLGWDEAGMPGLSDAIDAALATLLVTVRTATHAAALIHLAPDFPGTLAELFEVSRAVAD